MKAVVHINDMAFSVVGIVSLLLLAGFAAGMILHYRAIKARQRQQLDEMPESDALPEGELVPARVAATRIHRFYTGSRRSPIYNEEFQVKFQLESGEEILCRVPKETYYAINEGDTGMLLHVNGNFLDFGEGVECDTAM